MTGLSVEERAELKRDKDRAEDISAKLARVSDLLAKAQTELSGVYNLMRRESQDIRRSDQKEVEDLHAVIRVAVQRPVGVLQRRWDENALVRGEK